LPLDSHYVNFVDSKGQLKIDAGINRLDVLAEPHHHTLRFCLDGVNGRIQQYQTENDWNTQQDDPRIELRLLPLKVFVKWIVRTHQTRSLAPKLLNSFFEDDLWPPQTRSGRQAYSLRPKYAASWARTAGMIHLSQANAPH
jgi:hypothetical protein